MKAHQAHIVCAVLIAMISSNLLADERWWDDGHGHITAGAITHLPQPLRGFFEANSDAIQYQSGIEPPGAHYIDIDHYPEFFAGTFPHDLNALIALYGQSTVYSNGIAPWTIGSYTTSLSTAMAAARTGQDWLNLLPMAGALAHYVEDMHNPLHMTYNYNGQYTGNYGIHARYEGEMIWRHLPDGLPIVSRPDRCVRYASMVDVILDNVDVDYWYVDDIMAADTAAYLLDPSRGTTYYNKLWADAGSFTQAHFQHASEFVASAWYTAWVNAGLPTPVPIPVVTGDMDCNIAVDAADVSLFVEAVLDPAAFDAAHPGCGSSRADLNGDHNVDGRDIQMFLQTFLGSAGAAPQVIQSSLTEGFIQDQACSVHAVTITFSSHVLGPGGAPLGPADFQVDGDSSGINGFTYDSALHAATFHFPALADRAWHTIRISGAIQDSSARRLLGNTTAAAPGTNHYWIDVAVLRGDFQKDGDVDVFDRIQFLTAWTSQNGSVGAGLSADYDCTGGVDSADRDAFLSAWTTNYGLSLGPRPTH